MADLQNEFSWSFSRQNLFTECPKRYWYTYYGSWEGWPKTPWDKRKEIDPLAQYLYALKQMQYMATFVGSTVHETIEHFLKTKKPFALEALLGHGKIAFNRGLEESKSEKWRAAPKKHKNLFEDYYKEPITKDVLIEAENKVAVCLTNWYNSPVIQNLAFHSDARWLSIEELAFFQLANKYKIIVVIDFALMWQDIAILFDWKTGSESEKTIEQLYLYALFANKVWHTPIDKIILSPFYLAQNSYTKIGARTDKPLEAAKLTVLEDDIVKSCDSLSAMHANQDPQLFPYTSDKASCTRCPFKQLCQGVDYKECAREELREHVKS